MIKKNETAAAETEVVETEAVIEAEGSAEGSSKDSVKALEEEGDIAADYLEELLDIFDLDGDIDIWTKGHASQVEQLGVLALAKDRLLG